MKIHSHSLFCFCFVASIVALSICGCKKSGDIESNTAANAQTASTNQEQSKPLDTNPEQEQSEPQVTNPEQDQSEPQVTNPEQDQSEPQVTNPEQDQSEPQVTNPERPRDTFTADKSFEENKLAAQDSSPVSNGETTPSTGRRGSLDKRIIQKVIKQHANEIQACYQNELKKNKDLAGRIACQWTVLENGDVTDAAIVQSQMQNDNVEKCMLNNIKEWKFPPPKGGSVRIQYPFTFAPDKSTPTL